MTLEHACRDRIDRRAVRDVALLVLVRGRRAARQSDHARAARLQRAHQLGADPGGRAGDDGYLQTRTVRPAAALRPPASTIVASRACLPFLSLPVFHVTA